MLTSSRNKSKSLRQGIKATIGQLDRWDFDQVEQSRRRAVANSRFPHGFPDRLALAKHRAQSSGIESSRHVKGSLPYCDSCDTDGHSTKNCDVNQGLSKSLKTVSEDPSAGIHRAIIHRLYLQACELYVLVYPSFYPGGVDRQTELKVASLVSNSGPDYLELSLDQATEDLQAASDSKPSNASIILICRLYYSKSYPVTFSEFCDLVSSNLEDSFQIEV